MLTCEVRVMWGIGRVEAVEARGEPLSGAGRVDGSRGSGIGLASGSDVGTAGARQGDSVTGVAARAGTSARSGKPGKPGKPKPSRWEAPRGPYFNDPHLKKGWFNIERRVIDTIRHTPKGSTIRIAIYSLDRMPVAHALVAAHRRGVKVQMLLNDHWENGAMKVIRAEIGKNRRDDSFIYKCRASCRGTANEFNNLHSKFYLFSPGRQVRGRHRRRVGQHDAQRRPAPVERPPLLRRQPRAVPAVRRRSSTT